VPNGSRDVRLCFLVRYATIHCNEIAEKPQDDTPTVLTSNNDPNPLWQRALQLGNWAQVGNARMSPVMIYGLGEGTHQIILENRDHNRPMSIDAVLVQP